MPTVSGRYWVVVLKAEGYETFPNLTCLDPRVRYVKGQLELSKTGYLHWQCYAICDKITFKQLKAIVPNETHLELTNSDAYSKYVWKSDTAIAATTFEYGTKPLNRGVSVDWDAIRKAAETASFSDIPSDIFIRHYSALNQIAVDNRVNVPRPEVSVKVFVGPTETGKTRRAWFEAGLIGTYLKSPLTKWWCGYRGEKNVIIDEFCGIVHISHLLTWFDRYPCTAEVKRSSCGLRATNFWITTNVEPEDWYPDATPKHRKALMRRMTVIRMDEPWVPEEEVSLLINELGI